MSADVPKHIVAYPLAPWGHARPLINLCARLVKLRPVQVTFLTTNPFLDKLKLELARNFEDEDGQYLERIRIISICEIPYMNLLGDDAFKKAWKALASAEEFVCTQTGIRYTLPKPQAVIVDFFSVDAFDTIKTISGDTVKVFGSPAGQVSMMVHLFGPEKLGGRGNLRLKAEEIAKRSERPYAEVADELSFTPTGEVIRILSMPPMYDYELTPQEFPMPDDMGRAYMRVYEILEAMDGLFLYTTEPYEPQAVATVKAWFAETGRPAYVVGPLLPAASKAKAAENEKKQSNEAGEIERFLDATLKSSGEKSLVYISFGSFFWPVAEKAWAVLDVLIEENIPFIMSHASPLAVIPDEIREKVKAYGKGVLSPWSPQQSILEHPATGWFISHGGQSGVTEAISAGVPQIFWPFGADQPVNAVYITESLQLGYELLEVRTGHGLKPICRTGKSPAGTIEALKAELRDVLTKAFGADGAQKRERLQALRELVLKQWEDGGASKRDVTAFLDSL